MEIERCEAKGLATIISMAEFLVDFQKGGKEKPRPPKEKNGANGSHDVHNERSKVHKVLR